MKAKNSIITITLLMGLSLISCTNPSNNTVDGATADVTDSTDMKNKQLANPSKEGDALAILNAINTNDINAASEARTKKMSKGAMDYADMLYNEHTENMNMTLQLASSKSITIADNNESSDVIVKGQDELNKLKTLEGKDFEYAYIDGMIKGHAEALLTIDSVLMPMATNADVQQHLTETRSRVSMHLEKGRKLRQKG